MLLDASITKNTLSKSIKQENVDMDFQTDKKDGTAGPSKSQRIGVILTLSCTKTR